MAAPPTVRSLRGLDELRACVDLQEEVWGEGFNERVGAALLKVGARLGGVTGGAFDDEGRLVAFVFGLTGFEEGRPVHWSHMLAVRRGVRDGGLGRRLKAWQRAELVARGVTKACWTFDPLESRNGWLNLGRLGAVVRDYERDMYGESNSPRHRGVGTDRFLAVWDMDSERVERRLAGSEAPPGWEEVEGTPVAFEVEGEGDAVSPAGPVRIPTSGPFLVPVPRDIQSILASDPGLARRWREATRAALAPTLEAGAEVRELVRGGPTGGAYLTVVP